MQHFADRFPKIAVGVIEAVGLPVTLFAGPGELDPALILDREVEATVGAGDPQELEQPTVRQL